MRRRKAERLYVRVRYTTDTARRKSTAGIVNIYELIPPFWGDGVVIPVDFEAKVAAGPDGIEPSSRVLETPILPVNYGPILFSRAC